MLYTFFGANHIITSGYGDNYSRVYSSNSSDYIHNISNPYRVDGSLVNVNIFNSPDSSRLLGIANYNSGTVVKTVIGEGDSFIHVYINTNNSSTGENSGTWQLKTTVSGTISDILSNDADSSVTLPILFANSSELLGDRVYRADSLLLDSLIKSDEGISYTGIFTTNKISITDLEAAK
jgi:hypothetical protein